MQAMPFMPFGVLKGIALGAQDKVTTEPQEKSSGTAINTIQGIQEVVLIIVYCFETVKGEAKNRRCKKKIGSSGVEICGLDKFLIESETI